MRTSWLPTTRALTAINFSRACELVFGKLDKNPVLPIMPIPLEAGIARRDDEALVTGLCFSAGNVAKRLAVLFAKDTICEHLNLP